MPSTSHWWDGVRLHWVFEKSLGFPRHGFHLFRRRSRLPVACRAIGIACGPPSTAWRPGRRADSFLDLPEARLTSDSDLVLSDEFGWAWSRAVWRIGPVGFDLSGRQRLRLELPASLVERTDGGAPLGVQLQIGLRANLGVVGERIEFWRRPGGIGPNRLVEKGAAFRALDHTEVGAQPDLELNARGAPPSVRSTSDAGSSSRSRWRPLRSNPTGPILHTARLHAPAELVGQHQVAVAGEPGLREIQERLARRPGRQAVPMAGRRQCRSLGRRPGRRLRRRNRWNPCRGKPRDFSNTQRRWTPSTSGSWTASEPESPVTPTQSTVFGATGMARLPRRERPRTLTMATTEEAP